MSDHLHCHLCHARFRDDNHMAEHYGRHYRFKAGVQKPGDVETILRQSRAGEAADLQDLLVELQT